MKGSVYVVYLDVFFIINFVMDFLLLKVTRIIIKSKHGVFRIILSSIFGALYSVFVIIFTLSNHFVLHMIINMLASVIMILIAFGFKNIRTLVKNSCLFYIVSFLFCGVLNALYYSTSFGKTVNEIVNGTTVRGLTIRRFLVITFITYFIQIGIRKLIYVHKNPTTIYDIKLVFNKKECSCKALYDTGNSLCEPISGEKVHIVEYEILKQFMEGDETVGKNFCVIPFHSIGEESGIMYGFKVDEIIIYCEEEVIITSPIVAIHNGKISKNGQYHVILNGETFNN